MGMWHDMEPALGYLFVTFLFSIPIVAAVVACIKNEHVHKVTAIRVFLAMVVFRLIVPGAVARGEVVSSRLDGLQLEAFRDGVVIITDYYHSTLYFPIVIAILFAILFLRGFRESANDGQPAESVGKESAK